MANLDSNIQEDDDFEEIPPPDYGEDKPSLITDPQAMPVPQSPAPSSGAAPGAANPSTITNQYSPEEQERLDKYLQMEQSARQRASDDRHATVQSRAAAMLGSLGGVAPKSSLDNEAATSADTEANKYAQLQESLMKNATERQKALIKLQGLQAEKEQDREQQDKRDLAKQDFELKMASAKNDQDRQKAAEDYKKKLDLLRNEYDLERPARKHQS